MKLEDVKQFGYSIKGLIHTERPDKNTEYTWFKNNIICSPVKSYASIEEAEKDLPNVLTKKELYWSTFKTKIKDYLSEKEEETS